jgi:hypothetical protein
MPPKKQVKVTVIERTVTTKETRKETVTKPAPKPSYGACYRCGRTSHWSPDCYAKTDVEGYELDSD